MKAVELAEQLQKTLELTEEQKVDQYAEDVFWKLTIKDRLTRLDSAAKAYRAHFAGSKPTETYTLEGNKYTILVGPRENQRSVDVLKAIKLWTAAKIKGLFSISITALEGLVGKDEAAKAITSARSGSRDLTPVPREQA